MGTGSQTLGPGEGPPGFLDALLQELIDLSGADYVLVGELEDDDEDHVRVRRMGSAAGWRSDLTYALAGSPCEDVLECSVNVMSRGVAQAYPNDRMLLELGLEGYAGAPLMGQHDQVRGILVAMFRQPLEAPQEVAAMLERLAPRVALEVERLRFEERLAHSERRYRALVEQSSEGILVHRDLYLLYVNPALARIMGYDSAAALMAVGDIRRLLPPAEARRIADRVVARQLGKPVRRDYDLHALHHDGHEIALRALVSQVDWDGQPAMQVVLTDVTEQRQVEAREQQARRLESIGELTGGIAHDFNNLLTIVLGNLEMLAEQPLEADAQKLVTDAAFAAEQGASLTRRLLSFARRQPLQPRRVWVSALLGELDSLLRRTLTADIALHIEDASAACIEVDSSQLQTALLNLVINARDAIEGAGRISVSASLVDADGLRGRFPELDAVPHVCIEVSDTGKGMAETVRERAFEPFYSTRAKQGGSGLGLSMVHGFVRQSRGEVELDSAPLQGTRVRLYLPALETMEAATQEAHDDAVEGKGPTREVIGTILVVEDEPAVRQVSVTMLRHMGFEVRAAADRAEAEVILAQMNVDLLLADVMLPNGERGPEIAVQALRYHPQLKVVFMTGYAELQAFDQYPELHKVAVLRKPFRQEQLRQHILQALGGSET